MRSPFSFDGPLQRRDYALSAIGALVTQPAFVWLVLTLIGRPVHTDWWFWFTPQRALVFAQSPLPPWVLTLAIAETVLVDWLLVALAFRRAQSIRGDASLAAFSIVPALQILVALWFSLATEEPRPPEEPAPLDPRRALRAPLLGVLTGAALCVGAVALSALVLHVYGYGLFVGSPFVIGLITAYLANRDADLSLGRTTLLVLGALFLGAAALLGFAFEGLICLVVASPLIAAMGFVGGCLGRAIARRRRRPHRTTLTSVAVAPLLLFSETALPPRASFDSVEHVDIAAPPSAVWDAVVHMGPIPDPPPAPFRWGLSYPMRGQIFGSGVGAIRRGVFSTGVAYERVTEWAPEQKLSFIVLSDAPTMRELSPYSHVNAPHVLGYFHTENAQFTLTPLPGGGTRLSLATRHDLDLEPALYWVPFAEWATHANKMRVLNHFRQQAESSAERPTPTPPSRQAGQGR